MTEQPTLFDFTHTADSSGEEVEVVRADGSMSGADVASRNGVPVEEVRRFHCRLERRVGVVDLVVTDNRRRMVTARSRDDRHTYRLHHMFVGCDDETLDALAGLVGGERSERRVIKEYIRENRDAIQARPSPHELSVKGHHHHLGEVADAVRAMLNEPALDDVVITWGRDGRGRRSIRFGSFDWDQRLVRIHPALDAEWVPDFFVEFVVYHEMLHALIEPRRNADGSRRQIHTAEFRRREREYPRYEEALAWEEENLPRFLNRGESSR